MQTAMSFDNKIKIKETGEVVRVKRECEDLFVFWLNSPYTIYTNLLIDIGIISKDKVTVLTA